MDGGYLGIKRGDAYERIIKIFRKEKPRMISVIDVLMLMFAFGSFIVALISLVVWITTNIQKK